jgi:ureidoacrylate peracid hydrolase
MAGNQELLLDAAETVLLIIDMQNDFLDPDGYFAKRGMPVARLRSAIGATLALRDRLPSAVRVVYTVQVYEPDGSDDIMRIHRVKPAALARSDDEIPVRRGGWGAEIVRELAPRANDIVVAKSRFDAFYRTELESLLRQCGAKTLLFAGVVGNVCVETSLRSAFVRDFDVVLARECIADWAEQSTQRTIEVVGRAFGACLSNDEIAAVMNCGAEA